MLRHLHSLVSPVQTFTERTQHSLYMGSIHPHCIYIPLVRREFYSNINKEENQRTYQSNLHLYIDNIIGKRFLRRMTKNYTSKCFRHLNITWSNENLNYILFTLLMLFSNAKCVSIEEYWKDIALCEESKTQLKIVSLLWISL